MKPEPPSKFSQLLPGNLCFKLVLGPREGVLFALAGEGSLGVVFEEDDES